MRAARGLCGLSAILTLSALGVWLWGWENGVPQRDSTTPEQMASGSTAAQSESVPKDVLAARTVDRFLLFRTGNGARSMSLGSEELTALVTESLPGLVPAGLEDAEVLVRNGGIVLRARIVTRDWAGTQSLRTAVAVLPDRLWAELEGELVRVGHRLRLQISGARAQGVLLPEALVEALVRDLPMSSTRSEGPALEISLPDGIADVRIVGDQLILHAAEPNLERTVDGGADG